MNLYEGVYDDGIMYGVWESGPWLGVKMPKNTAIGWIGGGTAVYDLMVINNLYISRKNICFVIPRLGGILACL